MKTPDEIQWAHDLLVGIILGEAPIRASAEIKTAVSHMASVLCWVLDHDHNTEFVDMLTELEAATTTAGVQLMQRCRVCGCTEDNCLACTIKNRGEPCHWVEPDLCSVCLAEAAHKVLLL